MDGFSAARLHDKAYQRGPEPVWEEMRDEYPLFYDDIADVWWLTRYDDVVAVFSDHETYSASTYELSTGRVIGPTLISRDDHGHVVRRSIVAPDFVGKRLQGYRPLIENAASDLIDRFAGASEFDLVSQFSARLPVDVISAMLGMHGDGDLFRSWVTDMIRGLSPVDDLRARGLEATQQFCAHIAPSLDGVDDLSRTDHIAKIARARVDGEQLSREEITAFCGLLFIAGGETTDKAIANMWWNLWQDPNLFERVGHEPELWSRAFSETMRRTPPVTSEDRFTTKEVSWHGQVIPTGSRIRVSMGAAHLDPTVFGDPLRFDLDRTDLHMAKELRSGASTEPGQSGHLGFGLGKHFCIGYELARTEAIIGSMQLVERCPGIRPTNIEQQRPQLRNSFQAVEALHFSRPVS